MKYLSVRIIMVHDFLDLLFPSDAIPIFSHAISSKMHPRQRTDPSWIELYICTWPHPELPARDTSYLSGCSCFSCGRGRIMPTNKPFLTSNLVYIVYDASDPPASRNIATSANPMFLLQQQHVLGFLQRPQRPAA